MELAVGSEQKLYFCYDSSDPVGPSMIPIKTIVIEQVRRDISSVKQAYVKLACNRVMVYRTLHVSRLKRQSRLLCLVVYFSDILVI